MTITDANLSELLRQLSGRDRQSVEAHMRGEKTEESKAAACEGLSSFGRSAIS